MDDGGLAATHFSKQIDKLPFLNGERDILKDQIGSVYYIYPFEFYDIGGVVGFCVFHSAKIEKNAI